MQGYRVAKYVVLWVIFMLIAKHSYAQVSDSYVISEADRTVIVSEADTVHQFLYGNFKAVQDSMFIYADSAVVSDYAKIRSTVKAMSEVVMLQGDTVRLFADSMEYFSDTMVARFYDNVVLENGGQRLFSDRLVYLADKKVAYYYDTAYLEQNNAKITSLKGVFDIENEISYFYHHVTVEDRDFNLRSDSLIFYNTIQRVAFLAPTRITHEGRKIYCEDGYYDIDDTLGLFKINAQYVDGETQATADSIRYDSRRDLIELMGQARYINKGDTAWADVITYDERSGDVVLEGAARYHSAERTAAGDRIFFNKESEDFEIDGQSKIDDGKSRVKAKKIQYGKAGGMAQFDYDVVFVDTVNRSAISSDHLLYGEEEDYFLATNEVGKPVYSQAVDQDSMHISADTLKSWQEWVAVDTLGQIDTIDYIVADGDVEIFKSDMQAVSDSLAYNRRDSVFALIGKPVMWSDSSQYLGDTIWIYMRNETVDRIAIVGNALIISTQDMKYYSQIRGSRIDAYFVDGKIDSIQVVGNAQNVYYILDKEDAYIGVNTTDCSRMTILFDKEEVTDIKFYKESDSHIYPMRGTNHEKLRLKGFKWWGERRPLSSADLRT